MTQDFAGTDDAHDRAPMFVISVVAELTGLHAQTLRQYDRVGLLSPKRTSGGGRRYSRDDINRLREIQTLSAEGVGLAGIRRILQLQDELIALAERTRRLEAELRTNLEQERRRDAAARDATLPAVRTHTGQITVWRPFTG
jgi:MerR family transcriptional regulator/heat shock protein HspR